jgi:hypothetical protein
MAGKNLHVIPYGKKWAVKDEGASHVRSVFDIKQDAIDAAGELARSRKAIVVVHGRNGQPLLRTEAPSRISDDHIRGILRSGSIDDTRASSGKRASRRLDQKTQR